MQPYISFLWAVLRRPPLAAAHLQGGPEHPAIRGTVLFHQTPYGCLISAQVTGLPRPGGACNPSVFGFHVHSETRCAGNAADPFADAMTHYNPGDCPHPYPAGDLPPLFGADGRAVSAVLTSRFRVQEVLGRTVVIHDRPDDFTSQPAGNSGMKIACGVIRSLLRSKAR